MIQLFKNLKDIISIVKCRLAKRFALYTVSASVAVALVISIIFIYMNYQDDLERLKKKLSQVEHSIQNSLSLHLWQMNLDALNTIANDLLKEGDITYVQLLDEEDNTLIEKGKRPDPHYAIEHTVPIYYHPKSGHDIYLGKLKYTATTRLIYEKNRQTVLHATIAIFIFFLTFTMVLQFIYWKSTVKYLLDIKEYADKIRLGGYKKGVGDLMLNRQSNKREEEKDELDELADAINDMHREVIKQYAAIEYQALHDPLTDLPNRRMARNITEGAIAYCRKVDGYGALFSIDLDNFKLLNDSMGHSVGDRILCEISDRLKALCGDRFQSARISGDGFLVVQQKIISDKKKVRVAAEEFAGRLLSGISQIISVDGNHFKQTACIGIALFGAKTDPDIVVKQSDNALYHAKSKGTGEIMFFEPAMQQKTDRRLKLEQLIDKALEKDLIFINYQPKYDSQRRICSAEALVRIYDEENECSVSPGEFIPVLEETGVIVPFGERIIAKIFHFMHTHKEMLAASGLKTIAINVSPTQYSATGFSEKLIALAQQFDIDPNSVILEITEEVVSNNIDSVVDVMRRLTKHGFRFSIDDFGTGYSSLRYLKNLTLSELKIDKSFVDDITSDEKTGAIVKTIVDIAHNLDLDVVAEGIEREEQLAILSRYGCELYQGYLFSKPLMEEDFLTILQRNHTECLNRQCQISSL